MVVAVVVAKRETESESNCMTITRIDAYIGMYVQDVSCRMTDTDTDTDETFHKTSLIVRKKV